MHSLTALGTNAVNIGVGAARLAVGTGAILPLMIGVAFTEYVAAIHADLFEHTVAGRCVARIGYRYIFVITAFGTNGADLAGIGLPGRAVIIIGIINAVIKIQLIITIIHRAGRPRMRGAAGSAAVVADAVCVIVLMGAGILTQGARIRAVVMVPVIAYRRMESVISSGIVTAAALACDRHITYIRRAG